MLKGYHKCGVLPGIEAKRCSSPLLLDRVRTDPEESRRIDSPGEVVPAKSVPDIEVHSQVSTIVLLCTPKSPTNTTNTTTAT